MTRTPKNTKKPVREQLTPVGNNWPDILAWAKVRRPDIVDSLTRLKEQDAMMFLLAIGYGAGRCSVVAELDQVPIEEVARSW